MGCKVERIILPNGQSSDLFRELAYTMPPSRALETYLEVANNPEEFKKLYGENSQGEVNGEMMTNTPKYKLAEFDSTQQQIDTMDMLANRFIVTLQEMSDTDPDIRNKYSINGINIAKLSENPDTIPRAIELTVQRLKDEMMSPGVMEKLQAKGYLNTWIKAMANMPSYMVQYGEDGTVVLGPLADKLKDYGINLQTEETFEPAVSREADILEIDPDANLELLETQNQRIYDMSILESSPIGSVAGDVRMYLKRKPDVKHGESVPSTTGYRRPVEYPNLIGNLFGILAGVQSPEQVIERLAKNVEAHPTLRSIIADIKGEDGAKYKAALYTAFSMEDYNMLALSETGDTVVVWPANSATKSKNIRVNWAEDIINTQAQSFERKEAQIAQIYEYINDKDGIQDQLNDANIIQLKAAAALFTQSGFGNVTAKDLQNLIQYVQDNPSKYSYALDPTGYGIIKEFLTKLPVQVLSGKDLMSSVEDFTEGEDRFIRMLSGVVARRGSDVTAGAFLSDAGTLMNPINLGSEAQNLLNRIKDTSSDEYTMFINDPMYANNSILRSLDIQESNNMFEVNTMATLADKDRYGSGVTFGQLAPIDAIATRINMYHSIGNKQYFRAVSPTLGDRGRLMSLVLPRYDVHSSSGEATSMYTDGEMKEGEIKNWIDDQLGAEIRRIAEARSESPQYKSYGENAKNFSLFEELNDNPHLDLDNLSNTDESIYDYTLMASDLVTMEGGIFQTIIEADAKFIEDSGLMTKVGNMYKPANQDVGRILSADIGAEKSISESNMHNMLANNFIATYDQTMLYTGDPAFFKGKVDLNKRFALPFTPGRRLAVGYGIGEFANVKILKDVKWKSPWYDAYKEVLGDDILDSYKEINLADGAGFTSLKRYKELMQAQNLLTEEMEAFIDAHAAWVPGMAKPTIKGNIEVLKPFYYRLKADETGRVSPFNMKYSLMPVIPAYFEQKVKQGEKLVDRFEEMAAISRELREGTADEVVMESAVKVGARYISKDVAGLADTESHVISNESYRFPQPSTEKNSTNNLLGSQVRKMATSNFNHEGVLKLAHKNMDSQVALNEYNNAIRYLTKTGGEKATSEFLDDNGNLDEANLVKKLLRNISSNANNNVDYYKQALTTWQDGERTLPVNYPTMQYKMDSFINATYKNSVNRLKIPGYTAVQTTSFGTTREGVSVGSDLKFMRPIGNRIAPAEIRVTPAYFRNKIKDIAIKAVSKTELAARVLKASEDINPTFDDYTKRMKMADIRNAVFNELYLVEKSRLEKKIMSGNTYDIKKIQNLGLDTVVLYRIPTGGKNYMMNAVIKDFLQEGTGSTIQVPAEVVDQAGSDFDIDKVTLEMSDFREDDRGGLEAIDYFDIEGNVSIKNDRQAQSYIKDFHSAILASPDYFNEVMRADSSNMLTDLARDVFGKVDSMYTSNWASLELQEIFRDSNRAGKDLISISSVASAAHAMAPHIGARMLKPKAFGGKDAEGRSRVMDKLGDKYTQDSTSDKPIRISDEIAQLQTASLDNANDPLLGKLNINDFTAGVVMLLTSYGYGLKFATAVVNAPIVVDLARIYPSYSRRHGRSRALDYAIGDVYRKYGITEKDGVYNADSYTEKMALDNVKSPYTDAAANGQALKAFLDLYEIGDDLSRFQSTMNFDSKGTPSTVFGLLDKYTKLTAIQGTESHAREKVIPVPVNTGKKVIIKTARAQEATMVKESNKVSLNERKNVYEVQLDPNKAPVEMRRLSDFLGHGIRDEDITDQALMDASNKAGNIIDSLGRDYFITGELSNRNNLTEKAAKTLERIFEDIQAGFDARGEKVVTDKDALKTYDAVIKVAGEKDIVTFDKHGNYRIYDMKSERTSTAEEYIARGTKPWRAKGYIETRFNKRTAQLNGYRTLDRNTMGLDAKELFIIPIPVTYNEDGSLIEEVRYPKELLQPHPIMESKVPDTRVMESLQHERVITTLGLTEEDVSSFTVDPVLYRQSYMAEIETQSIHEPIQVHRKISPTASVVMQGVLAEARKSVDGRLTEGQEAILASEYATYLALNNKANANIESGVSDFIANNEQLEMTDPIKGLGAKIQNYRDRTSVDDRNPFIENLDIKTIDNRKFVVFKNGVSMGLSNDAKAMMTSHYEDLMYSTDGRESDLARDLANYAITHYGFSRKLNSFMDFIPPDAHSRYMNKPGGLSLPDFYREVYKELDNAEDFKPPHDFVDKWMANNADELPIRRIPKYIVGEGINETWQEDLLEYNPPRYVLLTSKKGNSLYGLAGGSYSRIPKRGISKLVVEYQQSENSIYSNETIAGAKSRANLDSKAAEAAQSEAVLTMLTSSRDTFNIVSNYETGLTNKTKAVKWLNDTLGKMTELTEMERTDLKRQFMHHIEGAIKSVTADRKRGNKETTYNDHLAIRFDGLIEFTIDPNFTLKNKILKCGS